MNELLKTQRISIAVLFFGLLLLIGLMVRKAPKAPFTMEATEMLEKIQAFDHLSPEMVNQVKNDTTKYVFIDLRSPYDFEVKHIDNAKNIPTAFILDDENRAIFQNYMNQGVEVVLYGYTQRESMAPWMLLTQIGFTNTKVLQGGFACYNGENSKCSKEVANYDYAKVSTQGKIVKVITEEESKTAPKPAAAPKPVVKEKKAIPVKKKKKRVVEGGC